MHKTILISLTAVSIFIAAQASAQSLYADNYHPDITYQSHPVRVGFGVDLGVPSGFAVGLIVHPRVDWVSLQASFTETYFAPGGRLSV